MISTTSMAPVAMVLPSSASATSLVRRLGHDAGADDGCDQKRRAKRLGRQPARKIVSRRHLSNRPISAPPAERSMRLRFWLRDPRGALAGAVAIDRAFARGQERFPGNAGGSSIQDFSDLA